MSRHMADCQFKAGDCQIWGFKEFEIVIRRLAAHPKKKGLFHTGDSQLSDFILKCNPGAVTAEIIRHK